MSRSATPARSKAGWEHFPHDADVGVRGPGATAAEAFEQAAHALTAVITHAEVEPQRSVEVRCEAPDIELSIKADRIDQFLPGRRRPHKLRSGRGA
jgi:SHS2 domain-containing protein